MARNEDRPIPFLREHARNIANQFTQERPVVPQASASSCARATSVRTPKPEPPLDW